MIVKFGTLNELWIVFFKRGHAFEIFFGASLQLFNTPWLGEYLVRVCFFCFQMQNDVLISVVEIFFYLGIFDCAFLWLLPLAVIVLLDDRRWKKEAIPKNFHYWPMRRITVYYCHRSFIMHWTIIVCAVLRIFSIIIVHHIPINERRQSHWSFSLSLCISLSIAHALMGGVSVPLLINEHLINPNLLSLAHKLVARHIVHHNNIM